VLLPVNTWYVVLTPFEVSLFCSLLCSMQGTSGKVYYTGSMVLLRYPVVYKNPAFTNLRTWFYIFFYCLICYITLYTMYPATERSVSYVRCLYHAVLHIFYSPKYYDLYHYFPLYTEYV